MRSRPLYGKGRIFLAVILLTGATVAPLFGQARSKRQARGPFVRAQDLVAVQKSCGGDEPVEGSLEIVGRHMAVGSPSRGGETLAFEENRLFVYAVTAAAGGARAGSDGGAQVAPRRVRRVILLKPSTLVVEDVARVPATGREVRWTFRATEEPLVEDRRFRVSEADTEVLGETLLPDVLPRRAQSGSDPSAEHGVEVTLARTTDSARFLHVFQIGETSKADSPSSTLRRGDDGLLELKVEAHGRVFRLFLPDDVSRAGEIEIAEAAGPVLQPRRLLPSGVLPHGPEGTRLVERWDAPYRGSRSPGWDVGRPSNALVQAVKDGAVKPGRAIVLGCGTGTNAIYLALQGFDVTAVDVAPTALTLARDKARKAGVEVRWLLADVVTLPRLEPFDLVFDRGCYHHVRRYDAAGYVETTRRLSRPGTHVLILAARDTGSTGGGPPPVKEEEIRNDFSKLFEIEWLREIQFDRPDPATQGSPAWSALLRRRAD